MVRFPTKKLPLTILLENSLHSILSIKNIVLLVILVKVVPNNHSCFRWTQLILRAQLAPHLFRKVVTSGLTQNFQSKNCTCLGYFEDYENRKIQILVICQIFYDDLKTYCTMQLSAKFGPCSKSMYCQTAKARFSQLSHVHK